MTGRGSIGADIRARRQTRGWSIRQLAGYSGVDKMTLHGLEAGKSLPSWGIVSRIIAALGGSVLVKWPKV